MSVKKNHICIEKFKHDNNRTNTSYKEYLQNIPLFAKEFLEENYELKFQITVVR